MLLAIAAIVGCALMAAWPSLALSRVRDEELMAAFPAERPAPKADEPAFELPRELTTEAVMASVSSAVTVLAHMAAPKGADPARRALERLVRRSRRTLLWPVPLAVGVCADVTLLLGTATHWAAWAVSVSLVIFLDAVLVVCAIAMLALSRRRVTDREVERFEEVRGARLRERAAQARERTARERVRAEARREAERVPAGAKGVRAILDVPTGRALTEGRVRLLGSGMAGDAELAEQLLGIMGQVRRLEVSPHRDGHADASAQIYAEQAVEVLDAYFELAEPTDADATQVRSVLGLVDEALDRESERLDGKTRLSLDATKRATEALFRQRYGDVPDAGDSGK